MKLNLGCGGDYKKGYVNIDAFDNNVADKIMSAVDLDLKDNSIEEIISSQLIEHLGIVSSIHALSECFRVLQPNLVLGIFGYIGASTEPTPEIHFKIVGLDKLVVTYTNQSDILWSDILIIGLCERSELDTYVSVGDQITNCTGTIEIFYIPTDIMVGYWNFW